MRTTLLALLIAASASAADIEFNRDVRPILSDNCFACHGPDKAKRKAKLRLDIREDALAHGAIVPGKPAESELMTRVLMKPDEEGAMPPAEMHKLLTAAQKDVLKKWIEQGAKYQPHWAYVPITRTNVPKFDDPKIIVQNAIDSYIVAELAKKGLSQSKEADKATLIRRLYLDLLGFAPPPEAVRKFVADDSPKAYETLVDALLANPAFGERMTVPWLDVVRYADTVGYHGDQNQRIFPYRDYVIDSFNKNKRFDQFTIEQIAGDLLPKPTPEQLTATGFNRLNMMTREGGAQPKEYIAKYQADRVRTVSMAWLGSTMGCAECHDHKYDPFTAKDFYSLSAFFADIRQWGVYADYNYTPNPDLKGWDNDHPFPPEIEVESDYLLLRRRQLQQELAVKLATVKPEPQSTAQWKERIAEFQRRNNGSFQMLPGTAGTGHTVKDDGRVVLTGAAKKGDKRTLVFKPGAGAIATFRLELLPDAAHKNRLTRDAGNTVTVTPTLARRDKAGKETKLPFLWGTADRASVIKWRSTNPADAGLLSGWRVSGSTPATATWALDTPATFTPDDQLVLTLTSDDVGAVRVSVLPLPLENTEELHQAYRDWVNALPAGDKTPLADDVAVIARQVLGTATPRALYDEVKPLRRQLFEMNTGKAWTQITVSQKPMPTRVLPRGNWMDESQPEIDPATPGFLPSIPNPDKRRLTRLDLANWIVSKENPLTARAFMNRLWKQFFGTGLSAGVEDLGGQGEWPTHPELLDYISAEFRDTWDVKRAVKMIVMSHTYRQTSVMNPKAKELDPANRLLSYLPPRRLEAEFVRDNALAISGLLNTDIGGPSAKPYQPAGYYANLQFPNRDYKADAGPLQYRRGLYSHWQRTFLHPMLANFDAPSREECIANRNCANTPQQALTLLNDPTFVEAARVLAATVQAGAKDDAARLDNLYERVLARQPKPAERESLLKFLSMQREHYKSREADAKKLLETGLSKPADGDFAEHAAWTAVCRVVLNLHETITRY